MSSSTPPERPMTLDDALVRKLERGEKRASRRVIPLPGSSDDWSTRSVDPHRGRAVFISKRTGARRVCTSSSPLGTRLYIRQNWRSDAVYDRLSPSELIAKVSRVPVEYRACGTRLNWYEHSANVGRHRAAMHMPPAVAKTRVAVDTLTVQRLQSLRDDEVLAEGLNRDSELPLRASFARAWSAAHSSRGWGWARDPWVWVIGLSEVLS